MRIAKFSMTIVDQFAIRNSKFAIRNFMILSGWESVFFWIFSIAAILAGLLTVMARNAVHSALFLISSLVSVAALFILLGAEFIASLLLLVAIIGSVMLARTLKQEAAADDVDPELLKQAVASAPNVTNARVT